MISAFLRFAKCTFQKLGITPLETVSYCASVTKWSLEIKRLLQNFAKILKKYFLGNTSIVISLARSNLQPRNGVLPVARELYNYCTHAVSSDVRIMHSQLLRRTTHAVWLTICSTYHYAYSTEETFVPRFSSNSEANAS